MSQTFKPGDRVYFYQENDEYSTEYNGLQGVVKSPLKEYLTRPVEGYSGGLKIVFGHCVEWANGMDSVEPPEALRLIKPDQDEDSEINQQTLDLINRIKNNEPAFV